MSGRQYFRGQGCEFQSARGGPGKAGSVGPTPCPWAGAASRSGMRFEFRLVLTLHGLDTILQEILYVTSERQAFFKVLVRLGIFPLEHSCRTPVEVAHGVSRINLDG